MALNKVLPVVECDKVFQLAKSLDQAEGHLTAANGHHFKVTRIDPQSQAQTSIIQTSQQVQEAVRQLFTAETAKTAAGNTVEELTKAITINNSIREKITQLRDAPTRPQHLLDRIKLFFAKLFSNKISNDKAILTNCDKQIRNFTHIAVTTKHQFLRDQEQKYVDQIGDEYDAFLKETKLLNCDRKYLQPGSFRLFVEDWLKGQDTRHITISEEKREAAEQYIQARKELEDLKKEFPGLEIVQQTPTSTASSRSYGYNVGSGSSTQENFNNRRQVADDTISISDSTPITNQENFNSRRQVPDDTVSTSGSTSNTKLGFWQRRIME